MGLSKKAKVISEPCLKKRGSGGCSSCRSCALPNWCPDIRGTRTTNFSLFPERGSLWGTFAFLLLIVVIPLTNCEHSFESIQENDRYHFSIYGTLDASADTQWVRVMPVRDSLFLAPKPIDAIVTLKSTSGGETIPMNDSLFRYDESAYAWNFWTTAKLLPGEAYLLTADRSDGRTSHATVVLPGDFPLPEVRYNCGGPTGNTLLSMNVLIEDVERLVVVELVYHYRIGEQEAERIHRVFRHLQNKTELLDGRIQVVIYNREDFSKLALLMGINSSDLTIIEAKAFIASAGTDWPDTEGLEIEEIALPDRISNVESGIGVLAGIVSKTVPLDIDRCGG